MPVRKFETFEEARDALWLAPGDPRIPARLRQLAELAPPKTVRRGVTKFHSIAEAKAQK